MKKTYEKYMKKCITLANKSQGQVSPNPLVGAIVFDKNGTIAGIGRHEKYGEAHAEVNAIRNAKENGFDITGGTIIVNLEPCSHFGKTPPCADLIIKEKLKKVVVGCFDPNPKVSGNGIKKLQEANIEVITNILEKECKQLNEIFIKNQTKNLPFIAIKTATTMDGKIATKNGSSKWITSTKARNEVQKLRNKYDAILTGSGTIITDNPSLTCRMKNGRNPIRIIIDSKLKTSPNSKVYINDGTKVYVAIDENTNTQAFNMKHVEFIKCKTNKVTKKIDLNDLIKKLFAKGINSILVEAGGNLNNAFIKNKLADKIYQFIAPKIICDNEAQSFVNGLNVTDINKAQKLEITKIKSLHPDILIEAYIPQ